MGAAYSVAWSPDGSKFALGGATGAICWDIEAGWEGIYLGGYDGTVGQITWSPDSTKIAGACDGPADEDGNDGESSIKVWDSVTGDELLIIDGLEGTVVSVAWSPDGTKLASGGFDNAVSIWDSSNGQKLEFCGKHSKWVESVVWSPDGTKLASCGPDETIRLWEVSTGKEILALQLEAFYVAWSPTGDKLASCSSYDHTAKVWDASNGKELHTLQGHEDGVKWVAWRKCGTKLASCSDDETVKIWSIPR